MGSGFVGARVGKEVTNCSWGWSFLLGQCNVLELGSSDGDTTL